MRRVIFSLLFVLGSCAISYSSSSSSSVILSDSDFGYKALEGIQKDICESKPTHPCSIDSNQCQVMMEAMENKLFPEDSNDEVNKLRETVKEECGTVGTRYEVPGVHWLLKGILDKITSYCEEIGVQVPSDIIFGGLPLAGVNAEMQARSKEDKPIILVNIQFLEFANEMAKLAAMTIPVERSNGQLEFLVAEEESRKKISSTPELREHFIGLIKYFNGGLKPKYLEPDEISKTVQSAYIAGIETFAVAHEVGHIYYNHPSSSFEFYKLSKAVRDLLHIGNSNISLSMREIEADSFALPVILRMRDDLTHDKSQNPMSTNVLYAVEFYFLMQQMMDEANGDRLGVKINETVDISDVNEDDVKKVATCALTVGCLARNLDLSASLRDGEAYPPHRFRAAVVSYMRKSHPSPDNVDFQEIAEIVNRNAWMLWELSREEYKKEMNAK